MKRCLMSSFYAQTSAQQGIVYGAKNRAAENSRPIAREQRTISPGLANESIGRSRKRGGMGAGFRPEGPTVVPPPVPPSPPPLVGSDGSGSMGSLTTSVLSVKETPVLDSALPLVCPAPQNQCSRFLA